MASPRASLLAFALAALTAVPTSGCGAVAQLAFGWTSEETKVRNKSQMVRVDSLPPGANVVRQGEQDSQPVGTTPLGDNIEYELEEDVETAGWLPMLVVGIAELLIGAGIAVAVPTEDVESDTTDANPLLATGGLFLIAGLVDTIWGGVRSAETPDVKASRPLGPQSYTYVASKDGLPDGRTRIDFPSASSAMIVLDPRYAAQDVPPPPPPPPTTTAPPRAAPPPPPPSTSKPAAGAATASWVVAVMDVEDANAKDRKRRVHKSLVRNLGDQLRIFVAQAGVRTIDRSSQDRALKDQLKRIKSDSYKQCYDDSCQIELGKALAASHILRSRITKFGKRCVLNGELIDLRAEVTVKAASAQGSCEAEGFLTMCDQVARDLVR